MSILAITHRKTWNAIADKVYRVEGGRVTLLAPDQPGLSQTA